LRQDVPPELEQLVLECLEKDPEARPRSVVEIVLALAPFASVDAQQAAARVARIVMRTTRPPPLPSHAPASTQSHRAGALVRSRPPAPLLSHEPAPRRSDPQGFGMLFAGAAIGLGASLIAVLVARPPQSTAMPAMLAPVTAPTVAAVAPVQAAAPLVVATSVAPVTATNPGAAAVPPAALPAPTVQPPATPVAAAAPVRPETRAAARPIARAAAQPRTTPRSERTQPGEEERTTRARTRTTTSQPPPDSTIERKVTASADDLFGSVD
jgi:hypothetical protein